MTTAARLSARCCSCAARPLPREPSQSCTRPRSCQSTAAAARTAPPPLAPAPVTPPFRARASQQSKRRLAFFAAFNTAFHLLGPTRTTTLRFGKRKLDVLCKDHSHKHADADFALALELSAEADVRGPAPPRPPSPAACIVCVLFISVLFMLSCRIALPARPVACRRLGARAAQRRSVAWRSVYCLGVAQCVLLAPGARPAGEGIFARESPSPPPPCRRAPQALEQMRLESHFCALAARVGTR